MSSDIRKKLIALKERLKDPGEMEKFLGTRESAPENFTALLADSDPKVRRNAALILGEMKAQEALPALLDTWKKEEKMFVRADYLTAMKNLDCGSCLEEFSARRDELSHMAVSEENRKHVKAELSALDDLLSLYHRHERHRFVCPDPMPTVVLLTNRCQREVTQRQITEGKVTLLRGGMRVENGDYAQIRAIRTYSEMLFPIGRGVSLTGDGRNIGRKLLKAGVVEFLDELHKSAGKASQKREDRYYYRLELRGAMSPDKKRNLIRGISEVLDTESDGRLANSTADYEIEIRLAMRQDFSFLPMLKLLTAPDRRFDYRKNSVASSIDPVNAALTAQLAKPYLREDAQVLDPFCGVGTMLIERDRACPAGTMYGIDTFGEAIAGARENSERAGVHVNYINRSFFDFTHEYLFDEVITDLPRPSGPDDPENEELVRQFFGKIGQHLTDGAVLVLYSDSADSIRRSAAGKPDFEIMENFLINERTGTRVIVLKYLKI